jgi:hypothetical protein
VTVDATYTIPVYRLRRLIGEMTTAVYSDEELEAKIAEYTVDDAVDLEAAALAVWYEKAARAANMVDVNESGSDRNLSQLYKNAAAHIKLLEAKLLKKEQGLVLAQKAYRAVGVSATPWGPISTSQVVMYGSNGSSNGPRG